LKEQVPNEYQYLVIVFAAQDRYDANQDNHADDDIASDIHRRVLYFCAPAQ
jgi:hypothetical protein